MGRRIDFYRIGTGVDLGDPETWNDRFEDLDLRADKLERDLADVNAVGDRIEGVALQRINEVVLPLVTEAQERLADLTNLFAAVSASSVEVGVGAKTFVITEGFRDTWVVPEYVWVEKVADPATWMSGRTTSFNRSTGQFVVEIEDAAGTGTHSSWGMGVAGRRGPVGDRGATGMVFRGTYSAGTTYALGDVVRYDRSGWVAKGITLGNSPPDLPTTSNTHWDLLAEHGVDGTGAVAIPTVYTETVAGGPKTTFTITGGYDATASKAVYLNGAKQPASAFTATNGTTVVMGSSQADGVIFEFNAYASFALADVLQRDLNLSDLPNADTGLVNLGGTSVGRAVFKAADQAAARSAIGAPAIAHSHAIDNITNLQTSLDAKAPKASPTFTGAVTIPTPDDADNTQKAASTEWVNARVLKRVRADAAQSFTDPEKVQARANIGAMVAGNVDVMTRLASGSGTNFGYLLLDLAAHITAGRRKFRLKLHNYRTVVDAMNMVMSVSANGGASFPADIYKYTSIVAGDDYTVGLSTQSSVDDAAFILSGVSNGSGNECSGWIDFECGTGHFDFTSHMFAYFAAGYGAGMHIAAGKIGLANVNYLRFETYTGNIASAAWSLYGVA